MSSLKIAAAVPICAMALAAGLAPAHAADAVENFYRGKTVQVLIGFGPGGGYDLYARTLARYMGKHIPGNPTMVPQNMPGAGGVKAMNYLYNVARKDGTVIGTFSRGLAIEPLLGHAQGTQFQAAKFGWIGMITRTGAAPILYTWNTSPSKTFEDIRKRETIVGAKIGRAHV